MTERPLRICMLTTFYPPYHFGGDAVFVRHLSEALARRGHQVEVVHNLDAYRFLGGQTRQTPPPEAVRVHRLESRSPTFSLLLSHQTGRPVLYTSHLRKILHDGEFDVLHFHNISLLGGPGVLTLGQAVKLYTTHEHWLICPTHVLWKFNREPCEHKVCFACTLHSGRPPQLWRYSRLRSRAIEHLDAILCPSRFTLERHRRDGIRGNLVHLPHFVPLAAQEEKDPGLPPYFLVVSRLEKLKGVHTLIPPFSRYTKAELWIVGTGRDENELRRLGKTNPRIRFLGFQPDRQLSKLYRNALALIVPSLCYEVFGIVILEAFTQSTPVVARRLGALTEIVEESRGGVLYSSDEELMAALSTIQEDPATRESLGRAGREALLARWTEEQHVRKYLGLIEALEARR